MFNKFRIAHVSPFFSDFILCPPIFVEMWAKSPEKVKHIKSLKGGLVSASNSKGEPRSCFHYQWYAGAPLAKATGDELHGQGVPLYQLYGA